MTSAIARWHSSARPPSDALEQAYADQLEAEMQEMAIQLHRVMEYWQCKNYFSCPEKHRVVNLVLVYFLFFFKNVLLL